MDCPLEEALLITAKTIFQTLQYYLAIKNLDLSIKNCVAETNMIYMLPIITKQPYILFNCFQVFDGPQETDPLLGTYCGTELPAPVYSTGNQVRIKMRTDYSVSGAGFHLAYVTSKLIFIWLETPCMYWPLNMYESKFEMSYIQGFCLTHIQGPMIRMRLFLHNNDIIGNTKG